jgi:hypothetical protein
MALHKTYGKDAVPHSSEGFISEALHGGHGPSEGLHHKKIDRKDQSILTAVAMDNVVLAMGIPSSILDEGGFRGGTTNLEHSLEGAHGLPDGDVGAAGPVRHIILPNH